MTRRIAALAEITLAPVVAFAAIGVVALVLALTAGVFFSILGGGPSAAAALERPETSIGGEASVSARAASVVDEAMPRIDSIPQQIPPIECPPICPPVLTVFKVVINDNGGSGAVEDFTLRIDGVPIASGQAYYVTSYEPHFVSEDSPAPYYTVTIGGDCAPDGRVVVSVSETRVCVVTNDDVPGAFPTWTSTPTPTATATPTLQPVGGFGAFPESTAPEASGGAAGGGVGVALTASAACGLALGVAAWSARRRWTGWPSQ